MIIILYIEFKIIKNQFFFNVCAIFNVYKHIRYVKSTNMYNVIFFIQKYTYIKKITS